ncbi:unnamed protein product [Phytomonas sp. EM1]|nr:unnamed protein product [Phytomonas sp. EM1]|eukprot:CCW61061.1 unnamed protein product [Phytomonas sp. isolate EM1]
MQRGSFLGLVLCLLFALLLCVAQGDSANAHDRHPQWIHQPSWEFIGGGFHMQLALDFPTWADTVRVSMTIDNTFFFDIEEIRLHYVITAEDVSDEGKASRKKETINLVHCYAPMQVESEVDFDIEAPSFHLPYHNATVVLNFERLDTVESAAVHFLKGGKLILPIHARYPDVIRSSNVQDGSFSPKVLLHGRHDAFQSSCLHDLQVSWTSREFGEGKSSNKNPLCFRIPTAVLEDLPMTYYSLVGLLWLGAAQVFACLCLPRLGWNNQQK